LLNIGRDRVEINVSPNQWRIQNAVLTLENEKPRKKPEKAFYEVSSTKSKDLSDNIVAGFRSRNK